MADFLKKIETYTDSFKTVGTDTKIDGEVATITLNEKDTFIKTLPEGLTEALVKSYESHRANFVAAATHVQGSRGNEIFANNPDVQRVEAHVPLFGDHYFDVIGHRESGEGRSEKYGDYMVVMHTPVEDGGLMAKVLKNLSAEAKTSWGSKKADAKEEAAEEAK